MTQADKLKALMIKANFSKLGKIDEIEFHDDSYVTTWDGYEIFTGPFFVVNNSRWGWQHLLFDHDFAKALFGENEIIVESGNNTPMYGKRMSLAQIVIGWQYRLQQAVISKDPISYMYDVVFYDKDGETKNEI